MMMIIILSLVLLISSVLSLERPLSLSLISAVVDYDVHSSTSDNIPKSNNLNWFHLQGNYSTSGRPYSAYYAVFNREYFSFYSADKEKCDMYNSTSDISVKYNCEFSTNGGFFNTNHSAEGSKCEGNLVSDSYVVQIPTDTSGTKRANLGINNKNEIIIGFMDNTTIDSILWTQLMTGNGWVVRNGQSYVNSSPDLGGGTSGFCTEKAPRTAVGMLNNGSMILLEIDGEEDINYGPDLHELADLLVSLGVNTAINIDGGGSATAVYNGEVIDYPTCNDTPTECQRPVVTITCVRKELV